MLFVPCPPLAADDCPFSSLFKIFVFRQRKTPLLRRLRRNKDDALAVPPCFPNEFGLFAEMPTHSPRYNGHDPSQDTISFPCALGGPFERSFPAGLPPCPRSLRGRFRSLSPLHSLWCELYTMFLWSSSGNNIFFSRVFAYFRTIDELPADRLNLSVLYAIIRLYKMVDAGNAVLPFCVLRKGFT
jgi:hypothetical protein